MKKLGKALEAAAKGFAAAFGTGRYHAADKPVRCTHCSGELFSEHEALLNTTIGVDRLNKSGTALICKDCGLIQWFGKKPQRQQP